MISGLGWSALREDQTGSNSSPPASVSHTLGLQAQGFTWHWGASFHSCFITWALPPESPSISMATTHSGQHSTIISGPLRPPFCPRPNKSICKQDDPMLLTGQTSAVCQNWPTIRMETKHFLMSQLCAHSCNINTTLYSLQILICLSVSAELQTGKDHSPVPRKGAVPDQPLQ